MSPSADVLVIGAGIVGAACAHELGEAGAQVELIDEATPGGGATAAGMGHLVVIDEPAAEFALTRWSMQRWQRLQAQLPERAEYSGCGTLWIASDEEEWQEAQSKAERMRTAGLECELVEPAQLARLEPQLRTGLRGALREVTHLGGHHGKTTALLAGARGLDGCVQGEEVGLEGDLVDHRDDLGDLHA